MSLRKSLRKYTHWFIELNVLNTYTTNRVICCFNTSRAFGKFTLWRSFLFFEVKSSKNDNSFVGLKAAALTGTNGERISARIRWPFNPLFADACQEKLNMQRVSRSIKCLTSRRSCATHALRHHCITFCVSKCACGLFSAISRLGIQSKFFFSAAKAAVQFLSARPIAFGPKKLRRTRRMSLPCDLDVDNLRGVAGEFATN